MYDLLFGHIKTVSPCKDCSDRQVGCHSNCKRYNEWRAINDANRKRKNEKAHAEHEMEDYLIKFAGKRQRNIGEYGYKRRGK